MSKDKSKDKSKGKDKDKDKDATGGEQAITLAQHPKAAGAIRRSKGRGGIAGFAIGALGTWANGGAIVSVLVHGLEGGIIGWLVCWFAAVTIWKHVVNAELRSAIAKREAQAASSE